MWISATGVRDRRSPGVLAVATDFARNRPIEEFAVRLLKQVAKQEGRPASGYPENQLDIRGFEGSSATEKPVSSAGNRPIGRNEGGLSQELQMKLGRPAASLAAINPEPRPAGRCPPAGSGESRSPGLLHSCVEEQRSDELAQQFIRDSGRRDDQMQRPPVLCDQRMRSALCRFGSRVRTSLTTTGSGLSATSVFAREPGLCVRPVNRERLFQARAETARSAEMEGRFSSGTAKGGTVQSRRSEGSQLSPDLFALLLHGGECCQEEGAQNRVLALDSVREVLCRACAEAVPAGWRRTEPSLFPEDGTVGRPEFRRVAGSPRAQPDAPGSRSPPSKEAIPFLIARSPTRPRGQGRKRRCERRARAILFWPPLPAWDDSSRVSVSTSHALPI